MKTLLTATFLAVIMFGTMYIMAPASAMHMLHDALQFGHVISVWLASFGL